MEDVIVIPKSSSEKVLDFEGKHLELLFKSGQMEGIIIEVAPGEKFGKQYTHDGEEIHFVLEGEIDYKVGEESYHLKEGDCLWHKSKIPHSAGNPGPKKAKYITIGVPPTFM